jgi:hypothetical protein
VADRRLVRAIPITLVLLVAAAGLLWVAGGHWRRGAAVLAAAAGFAAGLRLVVPDGSIGPLAVRSRAFDVTFLGALALLLALATTVGSF